MMTNNPNILVARTNKVSFPIMFHDHLCRPEGSAHCRQLIPELVYWRFHFSHVLELQKQRKGYSKLFIGSEDSALKWKYITSYPDLTTMQNLKAQSLGLSYFWHQLQVWGFSKTILRFDSLMAGLTELTDSYSTNSYDLLLDKDTI